MSRLPSASKLHLALTCPAVLSLPWLGEGVSEDDSASETGTAIHGFIEQVSIQFAEKSLLETSKEDALYESREIVLAQSNLKGEALERCQELDLSSIFLSPKGVYEACYRLSLPTGDVTFEGGGYKHGDLKANQNEIIGVLDRVIDLGPEWDAVQVDDWKTGRTPPSAKDNPQLLWGAICAAKHFGRSRANVSIVHLPPGGRVTKDIVTLDAWDLSCGLATLVDLHARAGKDFTTRQGKHCRYCPCFEACPASMTSIVRLGSDPLSIDAEITDLIATGTDNDAARAYTLMETWDSIAKRIHSALALRASVRAIPLPDGTVYGARESTRSVLDGEGAYAFLADLHGPSLAALAVKKKATKKGIEAVARAVSNQLKSGGVKKTITSIKDELLEDLKANGVMTFKTSCRIEKYKPGTASVDNDDE